MDNCHANIYRHNKGQGAQWPTMGSALMDEFPSFLQTIRLLDTVLKRLPDSPLWTLEGKSVSYDTIFSSLLTLWYLRSSSGIGQGKPRP